MSSSRIKPFFPILPNTLPHLRDILGVNMSVIEIDQKTETVKISIEGVNLSYAAIQQEIESLGGTIHSIDKVAAGKKIIEEVDTAQDR
jgi:hypothetical protein